MSRDKPKVIAIVGPTASGKTDLALSLARKFNGVLISADSRQVYRGMDIGTAKPTGGRWRRLYGHRAYVTGNVPTLLFDIVKPDEVYTVAEFKDATERIIDKALKAGKLPIIVGGTGLYMQALLENWSLPKVAPNPKLRRQLEKELAQKGLQRLYKRLVKLDPGCREFIDKDNPRRVIRALEVCLSTGLKFSELRQAGQPKYDALMIGLRFPRAKLYERINQRVDKMIKAGLEKEVRLLARRYGWKAPGMSGLGYRQWRQYLTGRDTLENVKNAIKKETRHYAKRQMTWFKKMKVKWLKPSKASVLVKKFIFSSLR